MPATRSPALPKTVDDLQLAQVLIDLRAHQYTLFDLREALALALDLRRGERGDVHGILERHHRHAIAIGHHDVARPHRDSAAGDDRAHFAAAVLVAAVRRESARGPAAAAPAARPHR